MSHIFGTAVDFNNNDTKNFRTENLLSFPTLGAPDSGRIILNTGLGGFYGWNGTSWINFAGAGSYTLPTATTSVLGGVKIDGTTITIDGTGTISSGAGSTGLEAIDEGNGIGWRLVGRNPAEFGNIGLNAVDFGWYLAKATGGALGTASFNIGADNTASGQNSVTFGYNNTASAYDSYTFGDSNTASNTYTFAVGLGNASSNYGSISFGESNISSGVLSFASGYDNTASGYLAFAHGWTNTVSGPYSMASGVFNNVNDFYCGAIGLGLDVRSPSSFAVGQGNTIYTNVGLNSADSRIFIVGNGTAAAGTPNTISARSDAFLVYLNGRVLAPSATLSVINNETTGKILTTKEWTDAKYLPKYLVNATVSGTYNIDWDYDTLRLTMTGATVFSDINLPTSGVNTKTLTIYMNGNFTPTWPAGWTTYVTGTYDGTVLNQIVVEFISTGVYWVDINRAD